MLQSMGSWLLWFTETLSAVLQGSDIIELYLAKVCNSIILNGSVCQAFNYNTETKLAFFKGQPPAQQIDYVLAACVMPNVSLWVATAGKLWLHCCWVEMQLQSASISCVNGSNACQCICLWTAPPFGEQCDSAVSIQSQTGAVQQKKCSVLHVHWSCW